MTRVLIAITGSDHWNLADGSRHTTGFWPEELVVPLQLFRAAGIEAVLATPGGVRPVPDAVGFSPDFNGGSTEPGARYRDYLAAIDDELAAPTDLHTVAADDFDLVFVPGGHGPMEDLATDAKLGALLRAFDAADKPVAAVCHGCAALLPAVDDAGQWVFAGRRVTGFSNAEEQQVGLADKAFWLLEDRLDAAGGKYESAAELWAPHIVVDGNLHTGQNPASSTALAEELIEILSNS